MDDFENYFRRASINDLYPINKHVLDHLRLEDGSWRFARKIFGKGGIFLNGQSVCRTSEQIEKTLNACGVFFECENERNRFFDLIYNGKGRYLPTKGRKFLNLKRLTTDNIPEYLISIEHL